MTRRVAHVFPYDPRQLGQDFERWSSSQLARWPLAAVARSQHVAATTVHVIGPRSRRLPRPPLEIVEHRSLASGPRVREWGDDWSRSLGRALAGLGPDDACVIHLNDYPAARLAQRAAARTRVVLVFHGRGLGRLDEHVRTADRLVVLREDAADVLRAAGEVTVMTPSVDRSRFHPAERAAGERERVLGFVGRLEESKGVRELPAVVRAVPGVRIEVVGAGTPEQRAALAVDGIELLGELPVEAVAEQLRTWRLLLLPSYTEGYPLTALEACASRVPVAAVEGVLPAELTARPGVAVAKRDRYAALVAELLDDAHRPPPADWIPTHEDAAAVWDELIESLPPWRDRPRPVVPRLARTRRLRPLRRVVRRVRGRR